MNRESQQTRNTSAWRSAAIILYNIILCYIFADRDGEAAYDLHHVILARAKCRTEGVCMCACVRACVCARARIVCAFCCVCVRARACACACACVRACVHACVLVRACARARVASAK